MVLDYNVDFSLKIGKLIYFFAAFGQHVRFGPCIFYKIFINIFSTFGYNHCVKKNQQPEYIHT